MNLLHVFLLSVIAFLLFKFLAPIVIDLVLGIVGTALNVTVLTILNAVTFGAIFLAIYKLNQNMKVFDI